MAEAEFCAQRRWNRRKRLRGEMLLLAFVAPLALIAPSIDALEVLESTQLCVVMDDTLPRPRSVVFKPTSTNFSAPIAPAHAPTPPRWWRHLSDASIDSTQPPYRSYEVDASRAVVADQVANCSSQCDAEAQCMFFNLIKVTPTSGQRGKLPLCRLYNASALPHPDTVVYRADTNFECGSKAKIPGGSSPPSPATSNDASTPCITLIATNGTAASFCDPADMNLTYTGAHAATTARRHGNGSAEPHLEWTLELGTTAGAGDKNGLNVLRGVRMQGWVGLVASAGAGSGPGTEDALEWGLRSAQGSSAFAVRAVDLGFAFVGVHGIGDAYTYTSASKTWCPIGTGCQEWNIRTVDGTVSRPSGARAGADTTPHRTTRVLSASPYPPDPVPWAHAALVRPGRSQHGGLWAADGSAGVGAFASQQTLPHQLFVQEDGTVGLGAARINTALRCGSVLPATLRWGMFRDISADGTVDADDTTIWTRRQYPLADWLYRSALITKLGSDYTSYVQQKGAQRVTFNATLDYVAALAHISDGMPLVVHLVGWQGSGHDTLFPSLDVINPQLGTREDLQRLFDEAKSKYNALISYHANTDEAYANFTVIDPSGDPSVNHPVPGTKDGQLNPDSNNAIMALDPAGNWFTWSVNGNERTDPLQGPSYHISKTKDATSGERWRRLSAMLHTVPLEGTLHSDAYRDIDTSFEVDEAGYIAEDEEMACGCAADARWLAAHNLSLGVEGGNGMASVGGRVPPSMNVFDYFWHGHMDLGTWGRIVAGSDQGLDDDMTPTSDTNPINNFASMADRVYLKAKVLALRMTDPELLSSGRFAGGGNQSHWPYGGDAEFQYLGARGMSAFLPVVLPPPPGSPKTAPTSLHPSRAHIYQHSGAGSGGVQHTWTLPASWQGKSLAAETITAAGRAPGPALHVSGRTLTLAVTPGQPVAISLAALDAK